VDHKLKEYTVVLLQRRKSYFTLDTYWWCWT